MARRRKKKPNLQRFSQKHSRPQLRLLKSERNYYDRPNFKTLDVSRNATGTYQTGRARGRFRTRTAFDTLRGLDGRNHPLKRQRPSRPYLWTGRDRVSFSEEIRRTVCKKRKERRERLFQIKKAGKGKAGPKDRQLTLKSLIKC